jgi:N-acetylglucosamine kinase-like BadF-type ATPase
VTDLVLGIDVGGSGSRLAVVPLADGDPVWAGSRTLVGDRLSLGAAGSTGAVVALDLVERALTELDRADRARIRGVAAGIAGLETNISDPSSYVPRLHQLVPGAQVALAADMVTAHLGALGTGGAVLAAGTGSIALGTDLADRWHRVDGWGHLIGDLGSGAWIGTRALQVGAAAADGRDQAGDALLAGLTARLGPPATWPAAVYHRADRAGVLAELARVVQDCARTGDAAAHEILRQAAGHLTDTLLAALVDGVPLVAAAVGGLVSDGSPVRGLVASEVARRRPDVELRPALGTPLDGAVRLAALAAAGSLPAGAPLLR